MTVFGKRRRPSASWCKKLTVGTDVSICLRPKTNVSGINIGIRTYHMVLTFLFAYTTSDCSEILQKVFWQK